MEETKGLPLSGIMGLVDTSCRRRVHLRDEFLVSTPSLGGKYHSTVDKVNEIKGVTYLTT
jgi:hypothetical protein